MIHIEDQVQSNIGSASSGEGNFCVLSPLLQFVTTSKHQRNEFKVQRCVVPPGVASSLHRHDSVEILHILEGCIEVFQSGKWTSVSAGSIVGISSGALHELRNEGSIPATLLCLIKACVDSPFPRWESCFDWNDTQESPTNEEMRQFFIAATRHAYWQKSGTAQRAHSHMREVEGASHSVYESRPKEVVRIEDAAKNSRNWPD
jgi:quercetin dioxygenase-like cupin family protein